MDSLIKGKVLRIEDLYKQYKVAELKLRTSSNEGIIRSLKIHKNSLENKILAEFKKIDFIMATPVYKVTLLMGPNTRDPRAALVTKEIYMSGSVEDINQYILLKSKISHQYLEVKNIELLPNLKTIGI